MKKLLNSLLLVSVPVTFATQLIGCNYTNKQNEFLSGFKNFDWKNSKDGEGYEVDSYSSDFELDASNENIKDLGNIKPDNYNSFLDYGTFNTGFKWSKDIEKQVSTGIPLNKGFMPNGNMAYDFGIDTPAQAYRRLNSILTFDPSVDMDAKYNKSYQPIRKRDYPGVKYLESQDERIKFNLLSYNTKGASTFNNSIVGSKNPFEITQLNWQYNTNFVGWSGSWYEGPIIPPAADNIESAHKSGAKIFGNIFLDGFHGLTKEMLTDFLKKDENGTFLIVDKLIQIATYMGFDGWYLNNEANGNDPSGTVINNNDLFEIVSDFNKKTLLSKDEATKNLEIIYYKNNANLYYDQDTKKYHDQDMARMATSAYSDGNKTKITEMQVNFGVGAGTWDQFLKDYPNYTSSNVYTIIDAGYNSFIHGTFDYRFLAYANAKGDFDKDHYSSFSGFFDGGSGKFGEAVDNILGKDADYSNPRTSLFKNQVNALFNDIIYSGTNLFVSTKDKGFADYSKIRKNLKDFPSETIVIDPRIHWDKKDYKKNPDLLKYIYNYNTKSEDVLGSGNGYNTTSLGIGNLIREKTVFVDENIDNSYLTTNFSTGSGIKFVEDQKTIFNNYPWLNRRLTDVLPTYKWRIFDVNDSDTPLKINEFSGGYDYDDVYNKGNSIVIGNGFDQEGRIIPATNWDLSKTYGWDIMGTNIKKGDKKLSFVYKDGLSENLSSDVKFRLTFGDKNQKLNNVVEKEPSSVKELADGWKEITLDLSNANLAINEGNVLSMVGLNIKPKYKEFKFNVGELKIVSNNYVDNFDVTKFSITNPKAEYVIYRKYDDQIKNSIRFNWEVSDIDSVDYFEIYLYKNNKWYRAGETTQDMYYLKNLDDGNIQIGVRPVFKSNGKKGEIYKFNVNL
ncbi:endo-beta-N-acetylglucosaminidase [Spiroplasma gladiatoris]|uniref:Endo-beta-N-acetylglucosaminidase n=1 Tax=Spiroplasma gladiatoris TaxID=2143 RepID=A0A4P7AGR4_9MOLU|nr:hypothetical protein [Spiroplasma gladiatoris]QBQ07281.1 endo-beta-N-acetylglucosaminidase [Spiroplasma gladiatoris]